MSAFAARFLSPNVPGQPRRTADIEVETDIIEPLRCDRWLALIFVRGEVFCITVAQCFEQRLKLLGQVFLALLIVI